MKRIPHITFVFLLIFQTSFAHEGVEGNTLTLSRWFGNYHYIFVHFPIALIIMACIAELLQVARKNVQLDFVVNFLLISAAIFVFPTVFSGLSLEQSGMVAEENRTIFEWHEFLGFFILSLAVATVGIRFWLGRSVLYFLCLAVLGASVALTSHLGGLMVFGPFQLLPPL